MDKHANDTMDIANIFAHCPGATNPFEDDRVRADAVAVESGATQYRMVRSIDSLEADEFEEVGVPSLEVMILWGDVVLEVRHLTPPRSFYVGEEQSKNIHCDVFVPSEKLGSTRAPVVLVGSDGSCRLVILPGATGWVDVPGAGRQDLRQLVAKGVALPCAEHAGASALVMAAGTRARVQVGDLVFVVGAVNAARKVAPAGLGSRDWSTSLYAGMSLVAHLGLLAVVALFMPPMGLEEDGAMTRDQLYLMQQYLSATAEPERAASETEQVADDNPTETNGGTGQRATGSEGSMGNPNSRATNGHYAVKGSPDNKEPRIARDRALAEAATFEGMIGLLNVGTGGDPNAPTAPWGREDSFGKDPLSALGNMFGADPGESHGSGGLGLSGIGEGGGGFGEGIGLGSIGTIGRGAGPGDGQGFGPGRGKSLSGHRPKGPSVQLVGVTSVGGRLPAEVIQRIVRQNYGRFRVCYEGGLRGNPNLQGRVSVRFVIGRDGAVSNVSGAGSDLPDSSVVQCVTRAYYGLSFPAPEGGVVSVTYPIMFTPGG